LTIALWSLGRLSRLEGDHDEAVRLLERAVYGVGSIERRGPIAAIAADLGHAQVATGRVKEGIALLEAQRAALDAPGLHVLKARFQESLGHAYLLAGRLDDAQACADEALALARHGHERGVEAWVLKLHGEIASRREPFAVDRAGEHYRHALALASELGMRPLMVHCHLGLESLSPRPNS
jgi:tetratricopeptide (TPR) repeat protein